jgi:hypothetical protein
MVDAKLPVPVSASVLARRLLTTDVAPVVALSNHFLILLNGDAVAVLDSVSTASLWGLFDWVLLLIARPAQALA